MGRRDRIIVGLGSGALGAAAVAVGFLLAGDATGQEKPSLPEVMVRMKYYNESLGVDCDYCHATDGKGGFRYEVDTPRKKTALWMQREMVDRLVTRESQQRIDCHTCHDGRARFLPSSQ